VVDWGVVRLLAASKHQSVGPIVH